MTIKKLIATFVVVFLAVGVAFAQRPNQRIIDPTVAKIPGKNRLHEILEVKKDPVRELPLAENGIRWGKGIDRNTMISLPEYWKSERGIDFRAAWTDFEEDQGIEQAHFLFLVISTALSGKMYTLRGEAEQPLGGGLNFRLGRPRA